MLRAATFDFPVLLHARTAVMGSAMALLVACGGKTEAPGAPAPNGGLDGQGARARHGAPARHAADGVEMRELGAEGAHARR